MTALVSTFSHAHVKVAQRVNQATLLLQPPERRTMGPYLAPDAHRSQKAYHIGFRIATLPTYFWKKSGLSQGVGPRRVVA